jgi:Kef-type K+ transport system membrane component KefB
MKNKYPRSQKPLVFLLTACGLFLLISNLWASGGENGNGGHSDPYARVFEIFFIILLLALVGRYVSKKLNQAAVLGELVAGIIAGAVFYQLESPILIIIRNFEAVEQVGQLVTQKGLAYREAVATVLNENNLDPIKTEQLKEIFRKPTLRENIIVANSIRFISSLGVLLLLFMVGLEISISDMKKSGREALLVAVLGVVFPFGLGYLVTLFLMPEANQGVHIFVAATLCATSIGITARVFRDLHKIHIPEARIVLGAAVIDDVLGLIILAIVTGVIATGTVNALDIGWIVLKSLLFFTIVIWFGTSFLKRSVKFIATFDRSHIKLIYPFALLMICSYLADMVGLATIVGAFAAGLIIREEAFQLKEQNKEEAQETIEHILTPLEGIFAPVFFVTMGLQVDVTALFSTEVLILGAALSAVAILGKWMASLPLRKKYNKLVIGFGMVPRGEVGLIFAGIGKSIGVLDNGLFAVVILVVLVTTLITPPVLSGSLKSMD